MHERSFAVLRGPSVSRTYLGLLATAVTLTAGCDKIDKLQLKVWIESADEAPEEAIVTTGLGYESLAEKQARLDQDEAGATAALDPTFMATLHPTAFARIVHLSDVQIREERGYLLGATQTNLAELASEYYVPIEGTKRPSLMEANSPFVWQAMAVTLDALHQQAPLDVAIHTGDAVDIGMKSELAHFFHVAEKLDMPFLQVAGNHDIRGFGIWGSSETTYGLRFDATVDVSSDVEATFAANQDGVVLDLEEHVRLVGELAGAMGTHVPTFEKLGSAGFGYDLAPLPEDAFYSALVRPAVAGLPGLQVIVLATNRAGGGVDAEMDDRQLGWLNDTLDEPATRANLVVVAAHHPIMEVHRSDTLGPVDEIVVSPALQRVRDVLLNYPNVILYLCGHTHLPEVVEVSDGDGHLGFVQIDTGSLLVYPQEGTLMELLLGDGSSDIEIVAAKLGPMVQGGSTLARRVEESHLAAASDAESRPGYEDWRTYSARKSLPPFPVSVLKYSL